MTALMTLRMSKDFFRPGLVSSEKISPTLAKPSSALAVWIGLYITVDRIGGCSFARESARPAHVSVIVMAEQDMAGFIDVAGPVLRLAIEAHDAVVAADALVVFGRDAARIIKSALAGEHHRRLRSHDQNAAGVHQHGGFGVPVGLRARR